MDPGGLLVKAARVLDADLRRFKKSGKLTGQEALDRGLLLYLLRQQGRQTIRQIGDRPGLTYSTASRRMSISKELLLRDQKGLEDLKSKIKMRHLLAFRLAVATPRQAQGVGRYLMLNAMERALHAAEQFGIMGFFVDAKEDVAATYCRPFGFIPLPDDPLVLFLPIKTIRKAFEAI